MRLAHISQPGRQRQSLLVYLHGKGEIGGETARQLRQHGPWDHASYDPAHAYQADTAAALEAFHVLAFHLPSGDWDGAVLDAEINAYMAEHPTLDPDRLYLTGVSLGGRGVLRLALHRLRTAHKVTAVAAFCPAGGVAGYSESDVAVLRHAPIYLIHAPEDDVVPFAGSAALHQQIGSASSRLRIVHPSELADPSGPHNCWTQFYGHPDFYRWLEFPAQDPADWPHLPVRHRT
jgi:predicted peptidase